MRGPDCNTDHKLIRASFKFTIKPAYSKNQVLRKRKLDTAKLYDRSCQDNLESAINLALNRNEVEPGSPEEMWKSLSQRVFEVAEETLGFTKKKKSDWFNEND